MRSLDGLLRAVSVAAMLLQAVSALLIHFIAACFRHDHGNMTEIGEWLSRTFETLGGGYLKIGQILSTRRDILAEELVIPLQRLQDSLPPFSTETAKTNIERTLGLPVDFLFRSFDPSPIGSYSRYFRMARRFGCRALSTSIAQMKSS